MPVEGAKLTSDNSIIDTFYYNTDYSGLGTSQISFATHAALNANTSYYLDVPTGAFYDCISTANYSNSSRIDFSTGYCIQDWYYTGICLYCWDATANILHLSPPNNGHFMQSYEGLNIVFDRNVNVGTGNIVIKKFSDDSVFETIDITSNRIIGWGTPSITINLNGNLADATRYYVHMDANGYRELTDKSNWSFYTKSTPNTFMGGGL